MPPEAKGPLAGIRVLDLATPRAEIAGRMLADLGADVLKVEPPSGAAARKLPPFVDGPERRGSQSGRSASDQSLYWAALALNKRSAVIDLDAEAGRERLRALTRHADVLIESYDPGTLDAAGLGYEALSALNPGLVYVSVTPFGQHGPKALWPATELTLEAAGGRISIQGDRDRPPLPIGYPQAAFHAGARAAADAIIALNERAVSGRGQRLDTSMQEAVIWMLMNWDGFPPNTGRNPPGAADDRADPQAPRPTATAVGIFTCVDGYVLLTAT
ncbi:MAG TPA: CoA transferase, partial [Dehalococcoidia bacterium]|nr:CoA transferase [Dehalococcoidia bacterium]